jgi:hypothetical protein
MKEKIWHALHADPQEPPDRVLSRCRDESVHCWNSGPGAIKLALFLQNHSDEATQTGERDRAAVRFAYRSFHPDPVRFTRSVKVKGGEADRHDPDEEFELLAGRTARRRYRTAILPDSVGVTRGPYGAQVTATTELGQDDGHGSFHAEPRLSVSFPEGGRRKCPCCS